MNLRQAMVRLSLPLVVMGALVAFPGSADAAVTFARTAVDVGEGVSSAVAVADFNGDGDDDFAVARGPVDVLLGQPGTGFAPRKTVAGGVNGSLAVADFNGDGSPDIAIGSRFSDVGVLLGRGDGTFSEGDIYDVGGRFQSIAVGDFNGDGDPDLVTANTFAGTVTVLQGAAGGTFSGRLDFDTGSAPRSVAVGDFDNNGDPDLVTANEATDNVSVLMGQDGLAFAPKEDFLVGDAPVSVAVGDLNGDDEQDLAVANSGSHTVTVFFGTSFGLPFTKLLGDLSVGLAPVSITLGDFNGDGRQDIVTADSDEDSASLLLGLADRKFAPRRSLGAGQTPVAVATGEFNQDGDTDLVLVEHDSDDASILVNTSRPVAELSPGSLSFPHTLVGATSARQNVTVKNTGDGGMEISGLALEGADADQFFVTGQNCVGESLRPGQSCTVGIRFRPTADGAADSALRLNNNAVGSPQRVQLTGIGGPPPAPAFAVNPTSLAFGDQRITKASAPKRVTVTNTGNADLAIATTTLTGAAPTQFVITANTCAGKTVAAGATCTVDVAFKPTRPGQKAATLQFAHNAPGTPHGVTLTGRGTGICLPILCL